MEQRVFGKTGRIVSEIGLGTWQLGTVWGDPFNREEALKILRTAEESGITFIDTADVYNGGKSDGTIGEYISGHPEVSVVIPGASRASQVEANVKAAELPPLSDEQMRAVRGIYDKYLRETIHPQW